MIKDKSTYETMSPESIGLMRGDSQSGAGIVLGKHSGRNAIKTHLKEMGYDLDEEKLNAIFLRLKEVPEKKKDALEDEEIEAIVLDQGSNLNTVWTITGCQVTTGMSGIPTATVKNDIISKPSNLAVSPRRPSVGAWGNNPTTCE
jgi:2-isopropylmalate synthase